MEDLMHLTAKTAFVPPGTRPSVLPATAGADFLAAFGPTGEGLDTADYGRGGDDAPGSTGGIPVPIKDDLLDEQDEKAVLGPSGHPLTEVSLPAWPPVGAPSSDGHGPLVGFTSMAPLRDEDAMMTAATAPDPAQPGSVAIAPFESGHEIAQSPQALKPTGIAAAALPGLPMQGIKDLPHHGAPTSPEPAPKVLAAGLPAGGGAAVQLIGQALSGKGPIDGFPGSVAPPNHSGTMGPEPLRTAALPLAGVVLATGAGGLSSASMGLAVAGSFGSASAAAVAGDASEPAPGVRVGMKPPMAPIDGPGQITTASMSWIGAAGEARASSTGREPRLQPSAPTGPTTGSVGLTPPLFGGVPSWAGEGFEQASVAPSPTNMSRLHPDASGHIPPLPAPSFSHGGGDAAVFPVAVTALAMKNSDMAALIEPGMPIEDAAALQVADDGPLASIGVDAPAAGRPDRGGQGPDPAPIARQVAGALADPSRDRGVPLDLTLDPPELGRLRLGFSEVNGVLTVTIAAERSETADLIRRHVALLAEEFARAGLDAPSVNISHGGADQRSHGGFARSAMSDRDAAAVVDTFPPLAPVRSIGAAGLDLRL